MAKTSKRKPRGKRKRADSRPTRPAKPRLASRGLEAGKIERLWKEAARTEFDQQPQALIGGMNVRLNLAKALEAAVQTAHAVIAAGKALASHGTDVLSILEAGSSAVAAATAGIAGVAEKMTAVDYIGSMVLSEHPNGKTEQQFDAALREFLGSAAGTSFPWYLGLTKTRLEEASEALEKDGIKSVLTSLEQADFLIKNGKIYKFKPRHFVWGLHLSRD